MKTETFDIVNKLDQVVDQKDRNTVHRMGLLHRSVHVFARSDKNAWILQQRSEFKEEEPLSWTTSCSGHVDSGEDYLSAAIRECHEELGFSSGPEKFLELLRVSPCFETGNEFVRIYLLKEIIVPVADGKEVRAFESFSIEDLDEKMNFDKSMRFSISFKHIFPLVVAKLKKFT